MQPDDFNKSQDYTLDDALDALRTLTADTAILPAAVSYGLSDLAEDEAERLQGLWPTLDNAIRTLTAKQLVEIGESNFELHYDRLGLVLLSDELPEVRRAAAELLWESDSTAVLDRILTALKRETEIIVKSELLSGLGRFILLGEYEEIPMKAAERAQETALEYWDDPNQPLLIRRRALEAISNSSREGLREMIQSAYESKEHDMQVSAVFAMGRSCDSHWRATVMRELDNRDAEIRYEAVRASGQLEIDDALRTLAHFVADEEDRELQEVSIWAIGEIGGDEAVDYLNQFAEALSDDDDLQEAIEDAILNAQIRLDFDALSDEWGEL